MAIYTKFGEIIIGYIPSVVYSNKVIVRIQSLNCKNEYAEMCNTDTQEHGAHRFNLETLKREKTMGEQSFTI